ncbi:hypothetical protein CERZMDRAFT_105969 [Cercospora zeae-maydis SCOH1-5]|uniref:Uncharacterized protein n=1 Tax=Cercospora zeae-maydis SCOH1-5 TaxID=717836 RepID=A0A6A6FH22_9PEZI|nr:hypothetical protein CERZMDRAFT_105969 [Cercospora zeae-maydis SCOH1-5]
MDHSVLRISGPAELARYLQQQGAQHGIPTCTKDLLKGIETESLPPTIYSIWLAATGDCPAVHAGLIQHFSRSVRHASIVKFGRLFRSHRAREIWQAVGGTLGIVAFLSHAAVRDIKQFCREVGRTWSSRVAVEARQHFVDELYGALVQQNVNPSAIKILERRPLNAHYRRVAPACSAALATVHVHSTDQALKTSSLEAHSNFFRDQLLQSLADEKQDVDFDRMNILLAVISSEQATYHRHRLPINIVFAIRALKTLSRRASVNDFKSRSFHTLLREKLFARLLTRRIEPELVAEVVDSYVQYHVKHVGVEHRLSFTQKKTMLECIACKWSRHPQQLEPSLIRVLQLVPGTQTVSLDHLRTLLGKVPWASRLRLFELAVQHISSLGRDISQDDDLKALPFDWDPGFFLSLDKPVARQLLDRLITLKPDLFGIQEIQRIDQITRDPTYLRLLLAVEDPDLLQIATHALEDRKKEAYKARKQPERCFWIQYALRCAAASCSLPLYRDTLNWANKYTRDPLTAAVIYSRGNLHQSDSIQLLRGFSAVAFGGSAADVQRDVQQANKICRELLETACEAVGEPNFARHNWIGVLGLMNAIFHSRVKHVDALQNNLQLSNSEVYDVVWKDTLEVCVILETMGLQDINADLEFNNVGGPLCNTADWETLPSIDDPRPATLRFVDQLAVRRNMLWKTYREAERPAVLALPHAHPRGLPFQYLLPVSLLECQDASLLPYLKERARQVVEMDPEFALSAPPEDEEMITAIGPFVENYQSALKYHTCWSSDRSAAALGAWTHATDLLSAGRMSPEETISFWSPTFQTATTDLDLTGPWSEIPAPRDNLELPTGNDLDGQPMEWNPDPEYRDFDVQFRHLPRVMLDVMINNLFSRHGLHENIKSCLEDDWQGHVPGRKATLFWQRHHDRRASKPTKEALIAAVLLYLSARNEVTPALLAAPYPSAFDPRYPAVYLDGDFLLREELDDDSIWDLLRMLAAMVPSTLLLRLTEGVLNAAHQTRKRTSQDALKLLQVLIKCDNPQVTLQLVQQIVLDRPEDSSWHRSILHPGLLNSLPEAVACGFITSLSEGIQIKLAGKATRQVTSGDKQEPAVKVTTVKLLAQLLAGAEFIDETRACQVLVSILTVAKHVDIVVPVVQSLVGILASTPGHTENVETVFDALERFIVPIISSINERSPLCDADWEKFEQDATSELPEIYMESVASELPPVLSCLIDALQTLEEEGMSRRMVTRVLLPALQGSVLNNTRWMKLSCRHLNAPDVQLPPVPPKLQFLTLLTSRASDIPACTVDFWMQVYRSTYDPSADVIAITERVGEDHELRTSNAGKHWLSLFSSEATPTMLNNKQLYALLHTEWSQLANGPSIPQIQNIVLQQADLILRKAGPSFTHWGVFITNFSAPSWQIKTSPAWPLWYRNVRPIVEEIYDRINALRTEEWQRNPHRVPAVLPDPFRLRLWLLVRDGDNNPLQQLIHGIESLLEEMEASKELRAGHYKELVVFLESRGLSQEELARMALALGNLSACQRGAEGRFDVVSYARVDLAKRMVERMARLEDVKLRNEAVDMVMSWSRCVDEDIRMVGLRMRDVRATSPNERTGRWYLDRVEE